MLSEKESGDVTYDYPSGRLAVFDFDGTLVECDSFVGFAVFSRGRKAFLCAVAKCFFRLVGWKLGLCSNSVVKEKLFAALWGGTDASVFEKAGERYASCLDRHERKDICRRMQAELNAGSRVIIITASVEQWVRPWAESYGISEVIATRPEISFGKLTGRFDTPNCYGVEKVRRLRQAVGDPGMYETIVFTDSESDAPLCSIADTAVMV